MHSELITCAIERDLLLQSSKGDAHAFTKLMYKYKDKLYGFLLGVTKSPELTEDLIQDIFYKLWAGREKLCDIEQFSPYLFRMAKNQAIDSFRKRATETTIITRLQSQSSFSGTDQYMNEKEANELLAKALSRLPAQQKLVFTLSREEGMKYGEIADKLNISPATVRNHMIAALRSLRKTLKRNLDTVSSVFITLLAICLINIFYLN